MIYPTFLTFVQFSCCSLSSASPPLLHCTKMSGRAMPAGPARQRGRLNTRASTYMRSKRAAQHGCVACVVVDTRRPNAVYGHAGIKSLQPRRWRGYCTHARCLCGHDPMTLADVGPCWCYTGRASGLATRSLRSSVCVMASQYNVSCKTPFWICGRLSHVPSAILTAFSGLRCAVYEPRVNHRSPTHTRRGSTVLDDERTTSGIY